MELRRNEATGILDALKLAIAEASSKALPESLLRKATQYALHRWDELTRYVDVGEAEIGITRSRMRSTQSFPRPSRVTRPGL